MNVTFAEMEKAIMLAVERSAEMGKLDRHARRMAQAELENGFFCALCEGFMEAEARDRKAMEEARDSDV